MDRPSAKEFGRFAEAAGRRFPSVDLWTLWNEPNHPGFLFPQATKAHVPYSPRLYRSLIRSGVAGLKRSGHGGQRILFGELLPIGKRNLFRKNTIAADPLPARALLPRLELARRTAGAPPACAAATATARSPA